MEIYDVVIIGAGMAGLTAAIYARRAGLRTLLTEGKVCGGAILSTLKINNYPGLPDVSGAELTEKIYHQVNNFGATLVTADVCDLCIYPDYKEIVTDEGNFKTRAVILAVGTKDKKMEVPREEELTGKGVSYCATCDGALYKGKPVAVVGGGNSALYEALYLADLASQVYIVHRRNEFRGDAFLTEKLSAYENVEFVMGATPEMLVGKEKVEGLTVLTEDGTSRILEVSAVFVAVGKAPATEEYADILNLDADGYVIAGEDCHTSAEGVFVAGDCRTKALRQLVTAAADGAVAASEAGKYLKTLQG